MASSIRGSSSTKRQEAVGPKFRDDQNRSDTNASRQPRPGDKPRTSASAPSKHRDDNGLRTYLQANYSSTFSNPTGSSSPLPSLYSDLTRQKRSNPSGYRANVETWTTLLTNVTFDGVQDGVLPASGSSRHASTSAHEDDQGNDAASGNSTKQQARNARSHRTIFRLNEATKIRWTVEGVGRPLGLGTVVEELHRTGRFIPLSQFLSTTRPFPTHYTSSQQSGGGGLSRFLPSAPSPGAIASTLLLTPLKFVGSQLSNALFSSSINEGDSGDGDYSQDESLFRKNRGDWVVYPNVERIASAFIRSHFESPEAHNPLSCLLTKQEMRSRLERTLSQEQGTPEEDNEEEEGFALTDQDFEVMLTHLTRDCGGFAVHANGNIKLASVAHDAVSPITEEDIGVVSVKTTQRSVEAQISELERRISTLNSKIKDRLRSNQKSQAMSYLRSRKACEELLTRRTDVLDTLNGILLKIEQAKGDLEIMKTYQTSSNVLHSILHNNPQFNVENVDKITEDLQENLDNVDQLDQAVNSIAATTNNDIDDDEIQQEFQELLASQQHQQADKDTPGTQNQEKKEATNPETPVPSAQPKPAPAPASAPTQEEKSTKDEQHQEDLRRRLENLRTAPTSTSTSIPTITEASTAVDTQETRQELEKQKDLA